MSCWSSVLMNWSKPSSFWATCGSFTLVQIKVTHILRPNLPLNTFLQESFVLLQWNESLILELDAAEFLLTPFPKNKSHFVFERFNLFNLHPQGNPIKNQSRMMVTTAVTRKWFQKVKLWNVPPEDVYGQTFQTSFHILLCRHCKNRW